MAWWTVGFGQTIMIQIYILQVSSIGFKSGSFKQENSPHTSYKTDVQHLCVYKNIGCLQTRSKNHICKTKTKSTVLNVNFYNNLMYKHDFHWYTLAMAVIHCL
jgi:hypothetical protein